MHPTHCSWGREKHIRPLGLIVHMLVQGKFYIMGVDENKITAPSESSFNLQRKF